MLNTFKALQGYHLDKCEDKFAFPVMRWMSGASENLPICEFANRHFFKLKPKIIFSILSQCPKRGFLKYPKKTKAKEDESLEILRPYLKQLYGWSDKELENNKAIIDILINKPEFLQELNNKLGFTKEECKKLGISYKVEKYEFTAKPTAKNLFSF
jgi:hypothetical protein